MPIHPYVSVAGVGKTSLVTRYIYKTHTQEIMPTIGATFFNCRITLEDVRVKLEVWDTAGQERFRSMAPMYYRNANAALLVFDLTNYETFQDIKTWVVELQRNVQDRIVLTLIGNKCDMVGKRRAVSREEATMYASSIGGYYFETTSLTSQGYHSIEKAFAQTALSLIHLSGESSCGNLRRYDSHDSLPSITLHSEQPATVMTSSAISLGLEPTNLEERGGEAFG